MKHYRKHIDDFFREKLGNYKETPPPEVWADLEVQLDNLPPAIPGSPYRWVWHAAIISLLFVLGVSVGRNIITNTYTSTGEITSNQNTDAAGRTSANTNGTKSTETAPQNTNTPAWNEKNAPADNGNLSGNDPDGGGQNENTNAATSSVYIQNNATPKHQSGRHKRGSRVSGPQTGFKHESTGGSIGEKPQGDIVYNNPFSEPGNNTNEDNPSAASPLSALSVGKQPGTFPGTLKNEDPVNSQQQQKKNSKDSKIGFSRFEAGVKAGYEGGFDAAAAKKLVISPYLQYNLSPKVSIMVQPGIKYADVSTRDIGNPQQYYNVTNSHLSDSAYQFHNTGGPFIDTYNVNKYKYSETHDSIVKSYKYGGSYMEIEMPVLLKYNISGKVSVYGGVNLVYNNFSAYTENTSITKGITRTITQTDSTKLGLPVTAPDLGFNYSGAPYSTYKDPYPNPQTGQLNIGYMVGFSYNYSKKWLFDALIQQTPVNANGSNSGAPLSSAYFRLMVGYKLTK